MIKTLLFGAGMGALQFIENTRSERQILAFTDNDENKHFSSYGGVDVLPPEEALLLEFDEIVITTQWATEVYDQLTGQMGIDPKKVRLPEKRQLKKITPFLHEQTAQLGRDIIVHLCSMAQCRSIPLVIDFGTLLGIVRDKDLIIWDDDIDFSVPEMYREDVKALLTEFTKKEMGGHRWHVEQVRNAQDEILGYLLKFTKREEDYVEFTTSVCLRRRVGDQALHLPSLGMWYAPWRHFETYSTRRWKGATLTMPAEPEDYLSFQYGDWQTPVKNMRLSDYANLNSVPFEEIKSAKVTASTVTEKSRGK